MRTRVTRLLCLAYYWLRIRILAFIGVEDALSITLERCIFPDLVLGLSGAKLGENVRVHRGLLIHESRGSFEKLSIGDDVFLGSRVIIDLTDEVRIGNRAAIGMDVKIITHSNYGSSSLSEIYPPEQAPVIIEDDAVVNWGSILLKGTVASSRSIVAPGSVAGGVLQPNRVYCGNPARPSPQIARVRPS